MQRPNSLQLPILQQVPAPSLQEIEQAVIMAVRMTLENTEAPGMFLSGGVDSTFLLALVLQYGRKIPVFTVTNSTEHPDLVASRRLAAEWGLEHYWLIPGASDIKQAVAVVKGRVNWFPGDEGVYLACKLAAAHGVKTLLATDGIDELTGGYWWHANLSERFPDQQAAFEYFWRVLWDEHIVPLCLSAEGQGIELRLPFLTEELVQLLIKVPLTARAGAGETKKLWKALARKYVPSWVVERLKQGFVSALSWKGRG